MAVLSDHDIWALLSSGRLRIDPLPEPEAVSPSAVDLTLDTEFTRFPPMSPALDIAIDARETRSVMEALAQLGTAESVAPGEAFVISPGEFALAWTREEIALPNFLCARVEGRSTLARLGLSVHQTAPTVHATFQNKLQLELRNSGPFKLKLYPGMRICQLIIETMSTPATAVLRSIHQGGSRA